MMALAPGQGPFTAWEDTTAVADGQGHALGGLDDPGGPADVQGLAGGPAQGRGQQGQGGPQPFLEPLRSVRVRVPARFVVRAWVIVGAWVVRMAGARAMVGVGQGRERRGWVGG